MRCLACDCALSDAESTRQFASSKQYIDLCTRCSGWLGDGDSAEIEETLQEPDDLELVSVETMDE